MLTANVLPFHPRDILDRATNLDPAFAAQIRRPKRRMWASVAALVALVVLGWAAVRETTPEVVSATAVRPSSATLATGGVQAASAPRTEIQDLRPLDEVLHRIEGPLRDCSKRTEDQLLLVQFQVAEGLAQFAQASPVGETSSAARRCILEALADVQFAPAPAETFALEYTP